MSEDQKKTEKVGVWMTEHLMLDLSRLAAAEDLKLSTYLERILHRHCYGHSRAVTDTSEGPQRPETGR